jgi:hypothetical protein
MQLRTHPVLLGECLGGALYIQDFIRLARQVSVFAWHSFLLACRLLVHLLRLYTTKYSENPHLLFRLFQVSASLNHVAQAGFTDPRVLEQSEVVVNDPELREVLGEARFFSMTYRYESVPARCPSVTYNSPFTGTGRIKVPSRHLQSLLDERLPGFKRLLVQIYNCTVSELKAKTVYCALHGKAGTCNANSAQNHA